MSASAACLFRRQSSLLLSRRIKPRTRTRTIKSSVAKSMTTTTTTKAASSTDAASFKVKPQETVLDQLRKLKEVDSSRDFYSDTATVPSPAMREAAFIAPTGDDVRLQDPVVEALQDKICELTGYEAALFMPSGTMTNQIAIRTHVSNPPCSVLAHARAHVSNFESAGIATLSQAMVTSVDPSDGRQYLKLSDIEKRIIPQDIHFAPTRLICLENTMNGCIFPIEDIADISNFAKSKDIKMHLDGARIWNASVASGVPLTEYAKYFDSMSICLSKGMGAPIGSVLTGSKEFIQRANHWRKQVGGGMRQSGVVAAQALIAIEQVWPQLARTHNQAKHVADYLVNDLGLELSLPCETNMIFVDYEKSNLSPALINRLAKEAGLSLAAPRLTFHYQITPESVEIIKQVFTKAVDMTKRGAVDLNSDSQDGAVYDLH